VKPSVKFNDIDNEPVKIDKPPTFFFSFFFFSFFFFFFFFFFLLFFLFLSEDLHFVFNEKNNSSLTANT